MAPAAQQPALVPSAEEIRHATSATVGTIDSIHRLLAAFRSLEWVGDGFPNSGIHGRIKACWTEFQQHLEAMECVTEETQLAIFRAKGCPTSVNDQVGSCGICHPIGFTVALELAERLHALGEGAFPEGPTAGNGRRFAALLGRMEPAPGHQLEADELARLKSVVSAEGVVAVGAATEPAATEKQAEAGGGGRNGKGGCKPLHQREADRRREVIARWRVAKGTGVNACTFCKGEGITTKTLSKWVNWDTQRRKREKQKPADKRPVKCHSSLSWK